METRAAGLIFTPPGRGDASSMQVGDGFRHPVVFNRPGAGSGRPGSLALDRPAKAPGDYRPPPPSSPVVAGSEQHTPPLRLLRLLRISRLGGV